MSSLEVGEPTIDRRALDERVDKINRLMRTHAGAIEVVDVSPGGGVTVRFRAMCQGCPYRPLTMLGIVVPALEGVTGVASVRALGVGISEESARRARAMIGPQGSWPAFEGES